MIEKKQTDMIKAETSKQSKQRKSKEELKQSTKFYIIYCGVAMGLSITVALNHAPALPPSAKTTGTHHIMHVSTKLMLMKVWNVNHDARFQTLATSKLPTIAISTVKLSSLAS